MKMNIGNKIREIRALRALNQEQLSSMVGVSRATLVTIEKKGDLKLSLLQKLAEALDVRIDDFFGDGLPFDQNRLTLGEYIIQLEDSKDLKVISLKKSKLQITPEANNSITIK